jgi:hypothetical protein
MVLEIANPREKTVATTDWIRAYSDSRSGDNNVAEANLWLIAHGINSDYKFYEVPERYIGFGHIYWEGAWTHKDPSGPWTIWETGDLITIDTIKESIEQWIELYGCIPSEPSEPLGMVWSDRFK